MPDGFFFLRDIVIVLGVGFAGAFVARRLKIPILVGYLLGGFVFTILTSGLFALDESLQTLADIGVALLLFTLGVEFSQVYLRRVRTVVLIGGTLQILLTIVASLLILPNFGFTAAESLFLGSVFSLSSTAVVVKLLSERGETGTLHGEILVGMLLLQDLAVIALMVVLPHLLLFKAASFGSILTIILSIAKASLIIAGTFFLGRIVIPRILKTIAKTGLRELLLLGVVLLALGFAFLSATLGLPPSIGAFLAGFLISGTIVNHAVFSEVRPLRDVFSIIFFVLLGMFLSPSFFFANASTIISLSLVVILVKAVIVFMLMIAFSYHTKVSFLVSSSLTSVGEFAFVLAGLFVTQNLITANLYNFVLSVSLITLLITPWQVSFAPKLYRLTKLTLRRTPSLYNKIFGRLDYDSSFTEELPFEGHVVLLGFGRVGRVVARVLSRANISFVGVDFNLSVVEEMKKKGTPFVYGDPSDIEVLDFAQVDKAKVVVVAVPDRHSQEIIIQNVRRLNRVAKIICRSHFEEDRERLLATGAHTVVLPEKEAGLTIAQKILSIMSSP